MPLRCPVKVRTGSHQVPYIRILKPLPPDRFRCRDSVDRVGTVSLSTAHSPKVKVTEPEVWSGQMDNGSFLLLLELNCVWLWTETENQSVTFFHYETMLNLHQSSGGFQKLRFSNLGFLCYLVLIFKRSSHIRKQQQKAAAAMSVVFGFFPEDSTHYGSP